MLPVRTSTPTRVNPWLVLFFSLLAISTSGPLVRTSNADPLAIAVYRLGFSLIVVAIALMATGSWRELKRITARELLIALGAGAMLALHFWSWNASIHLTTVAASVVLVNMHPPFVALLSTFWLREKPGRIQWLGIGVAMIGAAIVAGSDAGPGAVGGSHGPALLGDGLALIGALTVAVYFVAGRRLRGSYGVWPYVALVYGAAFAVLVSIASVRAVPLVGYPGRELVIFAALAAGPMLIGHTGMNYALRYLPAYVVNLTVLGEPVGASALAYAIPGIREVPALGTMLGGLVTLIGIGFAAVRRGTRSRTSGTGGAAA